MMVYLTSNGATVSAFIGIDFDGPIQYRHSVRHFFNRAFIIIMQCMFWD